jgi:hypothetical protein
MENTFVTNHSELLARLTELKSERETQEMALKYTITEFIATIDLVSLFKKSNTTDDNQPKELLKTGLNMLLNLITGLVLGKNRSIKGYLSAMMVERFTTMVIDNNIINIITGISSLIFRKRNQDRDSE